MSKVAVGNLLFLWLAVPGAALDGGPMGCQAEGDSCATEVPPEVSTEKLLERQPNTAKQFSSEHLLLQTAREAAVIEQSRAERSSSACAGTARRRRRNGSPNVCRRRHSSPGWEDTDLPGDRWKCDEARNQMIFSEQPNFVGFPCTGEAKSQDLWCGVEVPPRDWSLKICPGTPSLPVKMLTYNLFWWNLFRQHDGSDRSAGRLIARTSGYEQYDFMAFQECDDHWRIVNDAKASSMPGDYQVLNGGRAIAIAYLASRWNLLSHGSADVGEDSKRQYYGKRSVMWVRVQHRETGKVVLFMNHHGPLKVSEARGCTGSATAMNILRVIGGVAQVTDAIILTGDFNAQPWSTRIRFMSKHIRRVFSGRAMGGIDHIFTNCPNQAFGENLGKGDGYHKSDHDALSVRLMV